MKSNIPMMGGGNGISFDAFANQFRGFMGNPIQMMAQVFSVVLFEQFFNITLEFIALFDSDFERHDDFDKFIAR